MEESLKKEEAVNEKRKMKKGKKIFLIIASIILFLFFAWCMVVAIWPYFVPSYASIAYPSSPSGTLLGQNYQDEEILEHFSLTSQKRSHVHWTGLFSFETRHHYEYLLTSTDEYFIISSLTINAHYGDGLSFEVSFPDVEENLVQAYVDVPLLTDIELSSITYSVSSSSLVTGYTKQ